MLKLLKLSVLLVFALIFDLLIYGLTASCQTCTSFSQFLTTPASLAGPVFASLTALLPLTKGKK
ncbi:hypothetical protein FJZ40_05100 [Candidatus Shapirobacteria bacterium]|nr:hypothetical protein [Candidatus Shapirobacteria bacterium]